METFEILKVALLAVVFGALGVALFLFCCIHRNAGNEEDEEEDEDAPTAANVADASERSRAGWLEFKRECGESQIDTCLPICKIEYVAKDESGKAYIACYPQKGKHSIYYAGYDTVESYEEIIARLKGAEKKEEGER